MRIRTVKPDFFLHEEIYRLEKSSRLPVRIAFVGLWCAADREGRFRWQPGRLKVQILPYDNLDFAEILDALASAGFVVRYGEEGEFGCIPSFKRHQHVNLREADSTLPAWDGTCTHVNARAEGKGTGREQEGKGVSLRTHSADALSSVCEKPVAKMPPTSAELDLLGAKAGLPAAEVRKFEAYYQSNGWRVGKNPMRSVAGAMAGWKARWQERGGHVQPNGARAPQSQASVGVLLIARQKRVEEIDRELQAIEGRASHTATSKEYDEGDAMMRQDLIAERGELVKKIREATK